MISSSDLCERCKIKPRYSCGVIDEDEEGPSPFLCSSCNFAVDEMDMAGNPEDADLIALAGPQSTNEGSGSGAGAGASAVMGSSRAQRSKAKSAESASASAASGVGELRCDSRTVAILLVTSSQLTFFPSLQPPSSQEPAGQAAQAQASEEPLIPRHNSLVMSLPRTCRNCAWVCL
jgi:hypothetical protein